MEMRVECIPCFIRQAFEAVSLVTDDQRGRERILRQVVFRMANEPFEKTPPSVMGDLHRIVRRLSGNNDPYFDIKKNSNTLVKNLIPSLKELTTSSKDPFETAVRLAIAGNIIDSVQGHPISEERIKNTISECLNQPVSKHTINELREEVGKASNILYLGDNAGEVFFDKLLIEELNGCHITFVVRGTPIINDALKDDAKMAGLDSLVEVIDNGSDIPGTVMEECSEEFRSQFADADLVIAKGQGNYETLSDEPKPVFFLLKAKCPVIANDIGCQEGDMVIVKKVRPISFLKF